jgi:hypothetical protein
MINSKHIIALQKMTGEWLDIAICRSALENCSGDKHKAVEWLVDNGIIEYVKRNNNAGLTAIPAGYSELYKGAIAYLKLDDIIFNNRISQRFPKLLSDKLRMRMVRDCLKQFSRIKGLTKKHPLDRVDFEIIENVAGLFHYKVTSILQLPDLQLAKVCFYHIATQKTVSLFMRQ